MIKRYYKVLSVQRITGSTICLVRAKSQGRIVQFCAPDSDIWTEGANIVKTVRQVSVRTEEKNCTFVEESGKLFCVKFELK